MVESSGSAVDYLLSPAAIRERCERLLELGIAGKLATFAVDLARLDAVADYVCGVIHESYPSLDIPLHARWRHFDVGGVPRIEELDGVLTHVSLDERAAAKIDLAVTSVLLDAGAGPAWRYREAVSGRTFARSEGLAVASYRMFAAGAFSSDPNHAPLRADAAGLVAMTAGRLSEGFQVATENPLVGVDGRVVLMQGLGRALRMRPDLFGDGTPRPGNLVAYFRRLHHAEAHAPPRVRAAEVLRAVLRGFGPIWPGRVTFEGINLGDVWSHPALGARGSFESLVPFHKLSQWLTYSLVEPLVEAGIHITHLEELTGLPEYRNGGLLLDLGLIVPKEATLLDRAHTPDSDVIVEWRGLTVALLDRIGERVRTTFGKSPSEFPLAKVLEGGTWSAGRRIAAARRPGGAPPLQIESDGTVF
jgi:hypothetical protein